MSAPLSFTAACNQLGTAAYGVACAAWRAPFTGGKIRVVAIGLPVLFFTAAIGAAIYSVMTTILGRVYTHCGNGTHSVVNYFRKKTVRPIYSQRLQDQNQVTRRQSNIPLPQVQVEADEQRDSVKKVIEPVILAPLPVNAAKERNEALLKFLNVIDKYLINPWVIENEKLKEKVAETKDPFLNEMNQDEIALKAWLRSIALWQLGIQWDQLETKYVKIETPEPPTLRSLEHQVRAAQLETPLCKTLIGLIRSEEEGRITAFQNTVTESSLPHNKKMTLMGISLQLDAIDAVDPSTQDAETKKIRQKFAVVMHHGMATSLTQISLIIEGWMKVIQQLSTTSYRVIPQQGVVNTQIEQEDLITSQMETSVQEMVRRTSTVLSDELSKKYLLPLWKKQQSEWEHSVGEGLGKEKVDAESSTHQLVNGFMNNPRMSEEKFLLAAESYGLSTALTSNIAFFRAIRIMQDKGVFVEASIKTLPASLLFQLESVLTGPLHKTAKAMSEINLETTVPRIVDYALDLLECCRAMQVVRNEAENQEKKHIPLIAALTKGNQNQNAAEVQKLYSQIPEPRVTGRAIIEKLGPKGHKAARLSQVEIQERTWIHTTKERLEGLLRVKAKEYTQEPEGQWLATLLKSKPNGNGGNSLIGSLLSLQNKLWKLLPGTENIAKILIMGVQTFVEEKGCEGVQNELNKLTSTGFLSERIGNTVVNGLVDQSKEPGAWQENLPLLQQAYTFLQPKEQKSVLNHLKAQNRDPNIFAKRQSELTTSPMNSKEQNDQISAMKKEEETLAQSLDVIIDAYKELMKDKAGNQEEIAALQEAYDKLKRAKDLKQFERIKGLVIYVTDNFLEKKLNFAVGSNSLKQIILAVIHEAYTLLSYQEVVKHWIFTIVDLLLDELEEATSQKRIFPPDLQEEEAASSLEKPSILDFIKPEQQTFLLDELCGLMNTSSNQQGWLSFDTWTKRGISLASSWAPDAIWGYIEKAFKEDLRLTPHELTEKTLKKVNAFATRPTGLADSIIEALVENVADPRSMSFEI